MKLYATVTSERDSRPAKKGGDSVITITLSVGNKELYYLYMDTDGVLIQNELGEDIAEFQHDR